MAGNRLVVDPPSFTPFTYNLLSVIEYPNLADTTHWQNGITYEPLCGGVNVTGVGAGGLTYDACIAVTGTGGPPPDPSPAFSNTHVAPTRGATAFSTYVEFDCAPVGNEQAQLQAERALAMAEPWQVEYAFWTGHGPVGATVVFPHLASTTSFIETGTGITMQTATVNVTGTSAWVAGDTQNVATSLGLLETAMGNCYDGVGVVHVPPQLVPSLDAWGLLKTQGGKLYTLKGNRVACGAGYPGTSPAGIRTGNKAWMYGTSNVFGFRTAPRIRAKQGPEAFDRSENTMKMIAERTYVLGWDCFCHFAVETTLGVPGGS